MNRVRGTFLPLLLLVAAGVLLTLSKGGAWRSGKAEGAGWGFLIVGAAWLVASLVRVFKPLPIAVGVDVVIDVGDRPMPGTVIAMQGDECTVETDEGSFLVDR